MVRVTAPRAERVFFFFFSSESVDDDHNLLEKSENMAWWNGTEVFVDAKEFHVDTSFDMLSSGINTIKRVGDVLAGRVECDNSNAWFLSEIYLTNSLLHSWMHI